MPSTVGPPLQPYLDDVLYFFEWLDDGRACCGILSGLIEDRGHDLVETREVALWVLAAGFGQGWIVPGGLRPHFARWPGAADEWLDRIEAAWPVGRHPGLGEGCRFGLTESGRAVARLVVEARFDSDTG